MSREQVAYTHMPVSPGSASPLNLPLHEYRSEKPLVGMKVREWNEHNP